MKSNIRTYIDGSRFRQLWHDNINIDSGKLEQDSESISAKDLKQGHKFNKLWKTQSNIE